MHTRRTLMLAGIAAVGIAAAMSGCGSSSRSASHVTKKGPLVLGGQTIASTKLWSAAQKEGQFTYYAAEPQDTSQAILDRFQKETGIKGNLVRLSGGQLEERILSEAAGGKLAADVFEISDLTTIDALKQKNILQTYKVPSIGLMPKAARDVSNAYTPFYRSAMSLIYNTAVVGPEGPPHSWQDLLAPRWRGKIGIFDIGVGGSSWSVALFLRKQFGEGYWRTLAAQKPSVYAGNAPLAEALARGEISVGTGSPGFALAQKAAGQPIGVVFPTDGFPGFQAYLALSATAKEPAAGKVFMNWATSTYGQDEISAISGDYMDNRDAKTPVVGGVTFPKAGPWMPSSSDWLTLRTAWSQEYSKLFGSGS